MYYDDAGNLNVYVAGDQRRTAARSADIAGQLRARGVARRGAAATRVQAAKYDYLQLSAWSDRLPAILRLPGVVYTDIDEARNRLRVGMTPRASTRSVEQTLARLRIPSDAVVIDRIQPIQRLATLRDRARPLAGGRQIVLPLPQLGPTVFGICTLGFNARIPSVAGGNFFVTNSHCTGEQGGNQNTPFYQPAPPSASRPFSSVYIGIEYRDPAYGNPGGLCPAGRECRFSDAGLVRYAPGVQPDLGAIERTTFSLSRLGSIEIDPANPEWTIVDEIPFPFLGETVHKVGRSTGWTTGPVIITCADVNVGGGQGSDTGLTQLCQDFVLSGSRGGDSGSPVFVRASSASNDVFLTGLLWGGGALSNGAPVYVFSSMELIEFELGPLTTSSVAPVAAAR